MAYVITCRRPKIAVDLDNTLAASMKAQLRVHSENEGRSLDMSDIKSIDINSEFERLGLNLDITDMVYRRIWKENHVIPPLDSYTVETMGRISSIFSVTILTATIASEDEIKEWCQRNKIFYDHIVKLPGPAKFEFAKESRIYKFIDDSLEMTVVNDSGKDLILIRQPWNSNVVANQKNERLRIANDWKEVGSLLRF